MGIFFHVYKFPLMCPAPNWSNSYNTATLEKPIYWWENKRAIEIESSRNRVGERRLCSSVPEYGQASGSCCQQDSGSSYSMKCGGISELTEEILASQEELFPWN